MQADFKNNKIKLINTIGKIIKAKRIALNKTIYLISAESSMSKSTWREAELGLCNDINLTTLCKISEGLNIKPGDLINEVYNKLGKDFTLID